MKNEISTIGRLERGVVGIALIVLSFYFSNWVIFTALLAIGTFLMGEAFSGHSIYHKIRNRKK